MKHAPGLGSCPTGLLFLLACTTFNAPAQAQDQDNKLNGWSANAGLSSNYLFRGLSETDGKAAISGGFDYVHPDKGFYAGTWASNVDFDEDANIEIDYYGGIRGQFDSGLEWDVGATYYSYPGNSSGFNFFEANGALSHRFPGELRPTLDMLVAWSPDYSGSTGTAVYLHPTLNLSLPADFGVGLGYGYQYVEENGDYSHVFVTVSKQLGIIQLMLSYNHNFNTRDYCDGASVCDSAFVFSISSSF